MFYHKIETPFKRADGTKKLIPGEFRNETLEYLRYNMFDCTEKVDGTNIGIVWDGYSISIQGHSAKSTLPDFLVKTLEEMFVNSETEEMFEQEFGAKQVIFFGEGYGAKIQGDGHLYKADGCSFILFDVYMPDSDIYLKREDVEDIAKRFGIDVVPIVMRGTLDEAIRFVQTKPKSLIGDGTHDMEGLVLRPHIELRDRRGQRVIVKVKVKDFT